MNLRIFYVGIVIQLFFLVIEDIAANPKGKLSQKTKHGRKKVLSKGKVLKRSKTKLSSTKKLQTLSNGGEDEAQNQEKRKRQFVYYPDGPGFGHQHYFDDDYQPHQYQHVHHILYNHHHIIHGRCDPSPCLNGGTCTVLAHGYECTCPVGFLGVHCETRSQCEPNPCRNGGTCYDVGGSFECVCQTGYKGIHCEEENKCHPNPCKNGGTCTETEEGYECSCKEGFKGRICEEVNQCSPNPCKNAGTCSERNSKFECTCTIGFKGVTCEGVRDMTDGADVDSIPTGDDTQAYIAQARSSCSSNPCVNGGSCNEENFGYSCSCRSGYRGPNCGDHVCRPNPCSNGGTCYVKSGVAFCACQEGFIGEKCHMASPCATQPCLNGGTCYEYFDTPDGTVPLSGLVPGSTPLYHCHCADGFTGKNCEEDACRYCDVHAICDHGKCMCKEGFTGDGKYCIKKSMCHPNPCLNGGTCKDNLGSYDCYCVAGWTGEICQDKQYCQPNPCKNGGTCIAIAKGYECKCPPGYKDKDCQERDHCDPNPCENGGTCQDVGGRAVCDCPDPRYTGDRCQTDNCKDCENNNAECINGKCVCKSGFQAEGSRCIPRKNADPCANNQCQNGATCLPSGDTYTCKCPPGYEGIYCQDITKGGNADPCASNPCKNGGTCFAMANGFQCQCPEGFKGQTCDEKSAGGGPTPCHPNPCLNGGTCKANGNAFDCLCDIQYTGSLCEVDKCAKCDPHAKCINGRCKCRHGWVGSGYECVKSDSCNGKCGLYAECVTNVCQCLPGYTGNGYYCSPSIAAPASPVPLSPPSSPPSPPLLYPQISSAIMPPATSPTVNTYNCGYCQLPRKCVNGLCLTPLEGK